MRIEVNGEPQEIESAVLSDALAELGLAEATVATALNGDFVPRGLRAETRLSDGDRIEIVAPMKGG